MGQTLNQVRPNLPRLVTSLPGPRAQALIERDARVLSPS
jgi:4-aminobutyrate aminotransferase